MHFHHLLSVFCSDHFLLKKKDKHFNIIGSDYTVCFLVLHYMLLWLKWHFRKVYCYFGENLLKWNGFGPSNRRSIDILETTGERRLHTDVSVILIAALSLRLLSQSASPLGGRWQNNVPPAACMILTTVRSQIRACEEGTELKSADPQ